MAKPAACFVLTPSDHATLQSWLRMGSLAQSLVQRARILLLLADGVTPKEVSEQLLVSAPVVFKWRKRYLEAGLEGLNDLPRSGQPRKLSAQKVNDILTLTTRRVPREATHWSVRLMAKYAGVTTWQVRQVWAASDLKPHRLKTFKVSNDPHFADKVVDVVGLYLNPPDNALVLSVDEKTQIQALDRTQPMLPLRPGQIERRTHDYKRHGTASLYAAFDILTGKVIGRITQRHRAKEFLAFLQQIDRSTPAELDLHVILDNSSTHKAPRHQAVAGEASAFQAALHANQRFVVKRGRRLVRATGKASTVSWRFYQRGRPEDGYSPLHRGPQRALRQAIQMEQNG